MAGGRSPSTEFGPDYCFSASQLETYIGCPFQFFSKYVLKLKPVDERDELDEDYTERGSKIHDILETSRQLHEQQRPGRQDLERIADVEIDRVAERAARGRDGPGPGSREIERGRLSRTIGHYVQQRMAYEQRGEMPASRPTGSSSSSAKGADYPMLELAREPDAQAPWADRSDRPGRDPEGPRFRVIDYKSGSVPSLDGGQAGRDAPASPLRHGRSAAVFAGRSCRAASTSATGASGTTGSSRSRSRVGGGPGGPAGARAGPGRPAPAWDLRGPVAEAGLRELSASTASVCRVRQVRRAAEKHHELSLPELSAPGRGDARKGAARRPTGGPGDEES